MKMWISRDPSGQLVLSENKMSWCGYYWCSPADDIIDLNDISQFPEVTFENSPMEVELVIKSQNKVTECYNCHEVIKFTENDVIDGWYVKCPCCGEEISILL